MSDVFISYARSTEAQAHAVGNALRAQGFTVWRDDDLPTHRAYADVIAEQLALAKAVVVIWSSEAAKSQWVRSEADRARNSDKLVQLSVDTSPLPMPFDQIQCADLGDWAGDADAPGWRKVVDSVTALVGSVPAPARPSPPADAAPPVQLPDKPSIAVMPFANLSSDAEQDYFADGVMDEIVTALTRFRSVFVIASGSTMVFKGQAVTPSEAARRLGVRYILEGSVRSSAGRVRIAVKVTDTTDGSQTWAERFDDTLADVFALQDRVAFEVATAIVPALRSAEAHGLELRKPDEMGVRQLVVRGQQLVRTFRRDSGLEGLALLERAVALDPSHALAHAYLANACQVMAHFTAAPDAAHARGVAMAKRAVVLDGRDAEVLAFSANALNGASDEVDLAAEWIARALTLNDGSAFTWFVSGLLEMRRGAVATAIEHMQKVRRLDPLSSLSAAGAFFIAAGRFAQGNFEEALRLSRESGHLLAWRHALEASALGHLGRLEEGRRALATFRSLGGDGGDVPRTLFGLDGQRLLQEGLSRLTTGDA